MKGWTAAGVKKKREHPEADFQRQLVKWLKMILPLGSIVHASPNEEKSAKQAAINVGMGVFAGWADITILTGPFLIFLECKSKDGRQSADQKKFQRLVTAMGRPYEVVRTLDEALGALRKHAIPTRIISGPNVPAHLIRLALPEKGPPCQLH